MHWLSVHLLWRAMGVFPKELVECQTVDVLGFPTVKATRTEILQMVDGWISERASSNHLMALNPIKVCRARKEPELDELLHKANIIYPDAYGIAWAMRRLANGHKYMPIPGVDLMLDILKLGHDRNYSIYLVGARQDVVESLRDLIEEQYSGIRVLGIRNGYFADEGAKSNLIAEILNQSPDIAFVGMGARIQEELIVGIQAAAEVSQRHIPLLMGVGGSFDAITGHVPRPPKWMLTMHLEWLYRLVKQPFRAPRMLALPKFAGLILMQKIISGVVCDRLFDRFLFNPGRVHRSDTPGQAQTDVKRPFRPTRHT